MNPSGHSMALQPMINLLSMHEGMQRQEPLPELPLTPCTYVAYLFFVLFACHIIMY